MMEPHTIDRPSEPLRFVGPYRVLRPIADGGMASVYAVQDPDDGRVYATKVLRASRHGALRFGREYRALTRMDHPDVVRVYRYGLTSAGDPYLVMEFLEGTAAQAYVKAVGKPGDPRRTAEALRIIVRVAGALEYLHGHGIIHRDLKSTNVLVLEDGRVKLLDFGTVRLVHAPEALTDPGEFVGTFQYASPEQLTGGTIDARSDLYGLGVLAYRLLSGRRPLDGTTPTALARAHLTQAVVPLRDVVPSVPREVSDLVSWLLAKQPEHRPASARVVLDRLAPFVPREMVSLPTQRALVRPEQQAAIESFLDGPPSVLLIAGPEGSGRDRLVDVAVEAAQRRGLRTVVPTAGGLTLPEPPVLVGLHHAEALPMDVGAFNREREGTWVVAAWGEDALPPVGGRVVVVRVSPLTVPEVAGLAATRLGLDGLPGDLARRLRVATGGRLRLLETLIDALPGGADGSSAFPQLPDEEIGLAPEAMDGATRRVLEAVALAEGDLDLEAIAWAVDAPVDDTRRTLDRLVRSGILARGDGGWGYQLGLAGERIRSSTRAPRRSLLCRRLAERLLVPTPRTINVLLAAGLVEESAQAAVLWSEAGADRESAAERLAVYERVAARGPDAGTFAFWLRYAAASAEVRPEAAATGHALARARAAARAPLERGQVEEVTAMLARTRCNIEAEKGALSRALAAYAEWERPDLAAPVWTRLSRALLVAGDFEAAEASARKATRDPKWPGASRSAVALAVALMEQGDLPRAEAAARDAMRLGGARDPWRAHSVLSSILRLEGRYSDARRALAAVLARARAEAPPLALAGLLLASAELAADLGRLGEARERLAEGRALVVGEVPPRIDAPYAILRARLMERASDPGGVMLIDAALSRALSRGYPVHAARLRGFRGRLMIRAGRASTGDAEVAIARAALTNALLGSVLLAFERPDPGTVENPDLLYAGLLGWLATPHGRVARLDHAAVGVRFHAERGRHDAAARAAEVGRATFAEILALSDTEEREALRVHPGWRSFAE